MQIFVDCKVSLADGTKKSGFAEPTSKAHLINCSCISSSYSAALPLQDPERRRAFMDGQLAALKQWSSSFLGPGTSISSPTRHRAEPCWFVEKEPKVVETGPTRRSQGPVRPDVHKLMDLELKREEQARLFARGVLEEKRRIRWDLQSKREQSKRLDSERSDEADELVPEEDGQWSSVNKVCFVFDSSVV